MAPKPKEVDEPEVLSASESSSMMRTTRRIIEIGLNCQADLIFGAQAVIVCAMGQQNTFSVGCFQVQEALFLEPSREMHHHGKDSPREWESYLPSLGICSFAVASLRRHWLKSPAGRPEPPILQRVAANWSTLPQLCSRIKSLPPMIPQIADCSGLLFAIQPL